VPPRRNIGGGGVPCSLPHLPENHYAAPIGTVPVVAAEHANLVALGVNASANIARAVAEEREHQNRSRADLLTAIGEQHEAANADLRGLLSDARAALQDREKVIGDLIRERHADVAKVGEVNERAVRAENRDLRIQADDLANSRKAALEELSIRLDHHALGQGMELTARLLPGLVMAVRGGPSTAAEVAADLQNDPPPLCFAIVQLAWRIRDPDLIYILAQTLNLLQGHPSFQALGLQLSREAPEAFAQVASAMIETLAAGARVYGAAPTPNPNPNPNPPA